MAIREGKWKCTYCTAVNLGRDMKCAQCGATRDTNVEFFLEDDAAVVTDESLSQIAHSGADWHCGYCGTDNRAGNETCRQCGAAKDEGKSREEKMRGEEKRKNAPPPVPGKKRSPILAIAVSAAGALVILGIIWALFIRTSAHEVTVQSGGWERSVDIEALEWVRRTAWGDEVPGDAVLIDYWEEQRGTEKVQTGTEKVKVGERDKGNGFFEDVYEDRPVYDEKPVYDTKYEFEVEEWIKKETVKTSGGIHDPPAWPEPRLADNQRLGAKSESARLNLIRTKDGKQFTYKLPPGRLSDYPEGTVLEAQINATGIVRSIE